MTHDPGPVTIGNLRRNGKVLEIGSINCDWHNYFDPHALASYQRKQFLTDPTAFSHLLARHGLELSLPLSLAPHPH